MNKMYLAKKAKELCQIERLSADEIAKRLGISRRTVFNWIKQFDWKKPSPQPLEFWELQKAASLMLKSIEQDTEGKIPKSTISEMMKFVDYITGKGIAEAKKQKPEENPKEIPHEIIRQIEGDILGLRFPEDE